MKILVTSIKAATLSSSLLFLYLLVFEHVGEEILLIFFISIIITFFIAGGMIFFTIMPFSLWGNNNTVIFNKYFPFYAIVLFCICFSLAYLEKFESLVVGVLSITYITGMQSWVWIFKPQKINEKTT